MPGTIIEPVQALDPAWHTWLPSQQEQANLCWLPLTLARQFVAMLAREQPRLPGRADLERWGQQTIRVDDEGPYSLDAWYAYFARRKQDLANFLQQAIAHETPILCSL